MLVRSAVEACDWVCCDAAVVVFACEDAVSGVGAGVCAGAVAASGAAVGVAFAFAVSEAAVEADVFSAAVSIWVCPSLAVARSFSFSA